MDKSDHIKELEAKLAKLEVEEENDALLSEPTEEDRIRELEKTIAIKQRDLADKKAIRDAKKKFGEDRIAVLETRVGAIVLRAFTSQEYMEGGLRLSKLTDELRETASRDWMLATLVYPANASEILEKYPATWGPLSEEFKALHDATEEDVRGKAVL